MTEKAVLDQIALKLRIHSLRMTAKAGSGHPSTCLSMAEIAACLFFDEMKYNPRDPFDWGNDELVLSKGHAAPILWAAYAEAGIIPIEDLMDLRKISSPLEGHPTPRMPWIKAATGSLGQGLSVGTGLAAAIQLAGVDRRVYVVMGDGECAEGSVWEAANAAADMKLSNLCAVIDINRLGQSDATMHEHDVDAYMRKFEAFGWNVICIDGHDILQIQEAFSKARESDLPAAVLSKTLKGKGVSFIENKNGWHGKPLKEDDLEKALLELGPMPEINASQYVSLPSPVKGPENNARYDFERNSYAKDTATRRAYGNALVNLGRINSSVVSIDGDVKNSTYAEDFFEAFPERSFQNYIAEQNMVGMGIGFSAKGYIPFIATFAAFLTRAHDQIRMAAYSDANIKLVGSHVGVSIGEDGPSQMGLEDISMFRPIPGCVVLYPSDAYSSEACLSSMARQKGMAYLRTTRPATPLIYEKGEEFPIGGSKVIRKSGEDRAVVIAAGITVHEALDAYEKLKEEGIFIRIIDAYCIQPLDSEGINRELEDIGGRAVVVEDHFAAGGLGDAVSSALSGACRLIHLAVKELPRSGKPGELLDKYGISSHHIVTAIKDLLAS